MFDAKILTQQLGGRWHGSYGNAACPICQPEGRRDQDALSVRCNGEKLLVHCFKSGCDFRDIATALGLKSSRTSPPSPDELKRLLETQQVATQARSDKARRLWGQGQPIEGTLAEHYLRAVRGITSPLPKTLRFLPRAWHQASEQRLPALIARVDGVSGFAVHRTYLRPDGEGKADVKPAKAMLGSVAGGAVRLSTCEGPLVVAEGIETALSLDCGLLYEPSQIWAALSAANLSGLSLPRNPGRLVIASDGDEAGHNAARTLAGRATALGWEVLALQAPDNQDWNDVLRAWRAAA